MKKFSFYIVAFCLMSQQLIANNDDCHIDVRFAAFIPTKHLFRQIYGDAIVDYEIEIGKKILQIFEIWANVGWISTDGKTEELHSKTKYRNGNFSFGGKYLFCQRSCIQPYLGIGINIAEVHLHNDSEYVQRNVRKVGVGGAFKSGLCYIPDEQFFFEFFTDYLYQKIHFHKPIQIGGIKIGAGLGACF